MESVDRLKHPVTTSSTSKYAEEFARVLAANGRSYRRSRTIRAARGYPQLVSYVTTSNVATVLASLGIFVLIRIFW